jgi:hypothetical protein
MMYLLSRVVGARVVWWGDGNNTLCKRLHKVTQGSKGEPQLSFTARLLILESDSRLSRFSLSFFIAPPSALLFIGQFGQKSAIITAF